MIAALTIAILLLVIAIFALLFRASHMLGTVRKIDREALNTTQGVLFVAFMVLYLGGFWWYFFSSGAQMMQEPASEHGVDLDRLFIIVTIVILIPFTLLNILLFYFAYRFRYKKERRALFYPRNNKLEIIWTAIPAITLIVLLVLGLGQWSKIKSEAPMNAELVEIMAFQFSWAVRYPGDDNALGKRNFQLTDPVNIFGIDFSDINARDDFVPREFHVPKGKPVLFRIISRDVIHSVFAPQFRLKMDAIPGMPTMFWFVPRFSTEEMRVRTGDPDFNYEIACAELCGRGHFTMRLILTVDEPEEYEKWKKEQNSWIDAHPEYFARTSDGKENLATR